MRISLPRRLGRPLFHPGTFGFGLYLAVAGYVFYPRADPPAHEPGAWREPPAVASASAAGAAAPQPDATTPSAVAAAAVFRAAAGPPRQGTDCRVERVVDGDSMVCEGGLRLRLLNIDAPEGTMRPWGEMAADTLRALAPVGSTLRLETDVRPRDQYGRMLAIAWRRDGLMINRELARKGVVTALVIPPNVRFSDEIRAAVAEARSARRGLWATPAFDCPPQDYRRGRCGR